MNAQICETGDMRTLFVIAFLAAALMSPSWAQAQQASEKETELLGVIAKCLIEGLPADWQRAQMIIELDAPGAPSGASPNLTTATSPHIAASAYLALKAAGSPPTAPT